MDLLIQELKSKQMFLRGLKPNTEWPGSHRHTVFMVSELLSNTIVINASKLNIDFLYIQYIKSLTSII